MIFQFSTLQKRLPQTKRKIGAINVNYVKALHLKKTDITLMNK